MARRAGKSSTKDGGAGAITQIVLLGITEAPPAQRSFIVGAGLIAILAIGAMSGCFFAGRVEYAVTALVVAIAAVVGMFYGAKSAVAHAPETSAATTREIWSRPMVKLPLSSQITDELAVALSDLRNDAFQTIMRIRHDIAIRPDQVRANIFLADATRAAPGDVCLLTMPTRLQIGMQDHRDAAIAFRPRQGATGRVYVEQEPLIAKTSETRPGAHEFSEIYELTDEHKRMIHPQLRWIASFPLKAPGKPPKTIGVLNVDALVHQLQDEDIRKVVSHITPRVIAIAEILASAPCGSVKIITES